MNMGLEELLRGIAIRGRSGSLPERLAGVHYDSRMIRPGWAFVAIRGEQADGNEFVPQALARGAALVLSESAPRLPESVLPCPWIQVENARRALAAAAANWFGRPSERLRMVGVTGTNGKTTTTFLIESLLRQAGMECGLLGTIEYHIGNQILPSPHTTPESYDLQALLAQMGAAGCAAAVMEVSSHALAMERVWSCRFEVAVFTNLTQDHLDYHGTMENYAAAKRRLFQGTGAGAPAHAVVNAEDPASDAMVAGFPGPVLRYGFRRSAALRASEVENRPAGVRFRLQTPEGTEIAVSSPLVGRVNVLNMLAALGAGRSLGLEWEAMAAGAGGWARVRGRFEPVYAGQPFTVLVDYAHTPDALANVLAIAREMTAGKLRVVFGCGGDRDRGKRPLMGRAAEQGADWVLVTSDNPRHEKPEAIIAEVLAGMGPAAASEPDRRQAIRMALRSAQAGDTVVIAGKGHENYQIVGDERVPMDDAEEVRTGLGELGWNP
ncbi:MAG TPA: UDP-N-acetylmuramoyl-L-alanyl-D-glutamate--2,6-diaminopimelate ligase [Terriglobales bacterium]|nr:UDP-N-acetylmuramoyl-L-alanyl-D-glutamate--2,6-diaminopimelate ligase [Terriglobales bacterium]